MWNHWRRDQPWEGRESIHALEWLTAPKKEKKKTSVQRDIEETKKKRLCDRWYDCRNYNQLARAFLGTVQYSAEIGFPCDFAFQYAFHTHTHLSSSVRIWSQMVSQEFSATLKSVGLIGNPKLRLDTDENQLRVHFRTQWNFYFSLFTIASARTMGVFETAILQLQSQIL